MIKSLLMIALFFCLISGANANPYNSDDRYFRSAMVQDTIKKIRKQRVKKVVMVARRQPTHKQAPVARFLADAASVAIMPVRAISEAVVVIGGRPSGCPHRFCGCALAIKLFGRIVPHLNLASNWLKFPRTAPAPGMVAARRGHVFKLLAHVGGSTWQVWDANSGRGRIRIHNRSIAGYVIVNPSG